MRVLKNKNGIGTIEICVMIVIVCMLLSVFLVFAQSVNIVKQTKRNSRVVLDNYVMTDSIAIYNAIKQGSNTEETLDAEAYNASLAEFCTFVKTGNYYYNYDEDGNVQYYISAPTLSFTNGKQLKISASYTVFVPIYFAGAKVGVAPVSITVTSKLTEKQ